MTKAYKRIGLAIGAAALAVTTAGAGYQNLSAQGRGAGAAGPRLGGPGGTGGPIGRRGGPGGPQGGMLGPMMLERLDLTSDQRDRVRQILDSHREEQQAIANRAFKAREALQEVVTGTFDESAIRARAADVAAVGADMAVAHARVYGEVLQILTSEQQQNLKKLQAQLKERQVKMREQRAQRGDRRDGARGQR
jgi:Spy/CpxP family protein refolding chaperone